MGKAVTAVTMSRGSAIICSLLCIGIVAVAEVWLGFALRSNELLSGSNGVALTALWAIQLFAVLLTLALVLFRVNTMPRKSS